MVLMTGKSHKVTEKTVKNKTQGRQHFIDQIQHFIDQIQLIITSFQPYSANHKNFQLKIVRKAP
jgi:translation initiation factor 2B subunit (eIF-2B alpha/beta/delta family)